MAMTSAVCVPSRGWPAAAFLPRGGFGLRKVGFALLAALILPAFLVSAAGFASCGGFGAIALSSLDFHA